MGARRTGPDTVTIRAADGLTAATFAPAHGARGTSLILPRGGAPVELLYLRDSFWDSDRNTGGWPVLFPVCGRHLRGDRPFVYVLNGVERPMPMHGFGPSRAWSVEELHPDEVVMVLRDDEATRELFPFRFTVRLRYRVEPGRLLLQTDVDNHGDDPMPLAMGFHPYFALDPAIGPWTLQGAFASVGSYNASYTEVTSWQAVPEPCDVLAAARADAVFRFEATRPVTLRRAGNPWLTLTANAPGDTLRFPYLQLYRSADDPFVCLEPWMDLPNAFNRLDTCALVPPGALVTAQLALG
jgi:galactose mutarotase-like enzyme